MIHVVTYINRSGRLAFLGSFYDGLARHTAKCNAEETLRRNIDSHPEAAVRSFKNMGEASEWLKQQRGAA